MKYGESRIERGPSGPWESGRTPLRVQQSFKRRDGSKGLAKRLLLGHSRSTIEAGIWPTREDTKDDED
jgi:hypothetical protein